MHNTTIFSSQLTGFRKDLKILSYGEKGLASDEEYKAVSVTDAAAVQ